MVISSTIINSLIVVLGSIILDFLVSVLISIKDKTFDVSKLPRFLASNVLPYMGGLIILAGFANFIPDFMSLFLGGVGIVTLKFSKEALLDKFKLLFK